MFVQEGTECDDAFVRAGQQPDSGGISRAAMHGNRGTDDSGPGHHHSGTGGSRKV